MLWWQKKPVTKYGTPTNIILSTGVQDVEKGNIYSVPAGTPISIPVPSKVAWEDSQHVVLETSQGVLNILHVNPTEPVGKTIPANKAFGDVSYVGSGSHPGTYVDPTSGITYTESGNIIEVGLYDSVQRAQARENYVNGIDQPYNFTGIYDPTSVVSAWGSGNTPQTPDVPTTSSMSFSPWVILIAAIFAFIFIRRTL